MSEKIISPGIFTRENDQSPYRSAPIEIGAAIIGPTVKGRPLIPTLTTTYSEYEAIYGSTVKSGSYYYEYFTSIAAREYFQSGGKSLLVTRIISGSSNISTYATSNIPQSSSLASASFQLEVLSWGDIMNSTSSEVSGALASGSINNVRWEISDANYTNGTFTVLIRRGDDNNTTKNVLESWVNVSLDPMLPNYISRVIGDKKQVYVAANSLTGDGSYVANSGSFNNISRYVRVSNVNTPHIDSIDNNGVFKYNQYSGSLPMVNTSGSFGGGVPATNLTQNFNETIGNGNSGAANIQGVQSDDYILAASLLTNKDEYDFNLLLAPGVTLDTSAASNLISTCETSGNSMIILDAKVYGSAVSAVSAAATAQNSNYAAAYWPWVQVYSSGLGKLVWVPSSVVMGGVYAFNDQVGAEWFAPAGLTRGGIPSVVQAERKLQNSDRNTLYSVNINPLATFPGNGVTAWGQKTLQKRQTALDRVGVRRLLINLKRYVTNVSRTLVFEQNTIVTRNKFINQVNPYMESVVQRQGLYAFRVVMDDSNNTADVIDRNQLVGQILIQPTKTAEFIILDFSILPTGVTFGQ